MLEINGVKFDKGYYKKRKYGILLLDENKEPRVFLVANKHNEFFFVSCRKQESGKIFYFHSTTDQDSSWLDIPETMAGESFLAQTIWEKSFN